MTISLKVIQPEKQSISFSNELNRLVSREEAAHDKRNWVRLTHDCNNKCTFCLDSNALNGTLRDTEEIKIQIIEGRKKGMTRLILSGGEPTIHPNFLDFVLLGKRAGYPKVQTVTNGRMFSYPDFLKRAAENGLDEITFSLHGHNAKLHDRLVGAPGAFEQEVKGLKAALAMRRFIINIDIVINKQNVPFLPEILDTFISWGVKEFDLLHIIPFGNAWTDARHHLFYDLDTHHETLQKAFAFSKRPDVHIWLNRFPPQHAEGFEELIQDPYKLNDEVRGRREEFDRYISIGQKLSCREPERCQYCYLEPLCDSLEEVIDKTQAAEVDVIRYEAPIAGQLPDAEVGRIVARDLEAARAIAAGVGANRIQLDLESYEGLAEALEGTTIFDKEIERAYARDAESLRALLVIDEGFEVGVYLTKETAPAISALPSLPSRLVIMQPNYSRMTDQLTHDLEDIQGFFASLQGSVKTENIPTCLSKRPAKRRLKLLDAGMLGPDARIDMTAFTERYISDGFYTKSLRCRSCVEHSTCPGVHINFVRAHGYKKLEPITEAAE